MAICSQNAERLETTRKLCAEAGADVIAYACDVAEYEELVRFVDMTIQHFGTVDVLVNNVHHVVLAPFIDLKMEDFMHDLKVDFCSTWHLMQLLFPYMKDKPGAGASIINFGSRWGQYNIRCNIVCPGGFTDNAKNNMDQQLPEMQKYAMAD